MLTFLDSILSGSGYMPHGQCFLWQTPLIWLHAVSDALITLAYYAIPVLLLYFIRNRRDVPFKSVFVLFVAFILSCGTTHLLEVWTLWHPQYWISGTLKGITALISLFTVFELIPILPQALALPSPAQLEAANQSLAHEIQERKLAEARVRELNQHLNQQVQELERLNQLKDDFLSTVSHELRTPLTSMRLAIQLLRDTQKDIPWTGKQQHYLDLIGQSCQREMDLVTDLLDLQRLEAETYELNPEPIPLDDWIADLTQELAPLHERHHQQFSHTTSGLSSSAASFVTDRSSLDRILRELLHNAVKYTPAQGQIQLHIDLHIDRTEHSPPQLQITLRNTGEIPDPFLPHLFDKFYRVPRSDPWSYGGTGLGLALVKQLVTRLRGEIQVSTQGEWIEFRMCLPDLSVSKSGSDLACFLTESSCETDPCG